MRAKIRRHGHGMTMPIHGVAHLLMDMRRRTIRARNGVGHGAGLQHDVQPGKTEQRQEPSTLSHASRSDFRQKAQRIAPSAHHDQRSIAGETACFPAISAHSGMALPGLRTLSDCRYSLLSPLSSDVSVSPPGHGLAISD